ncbi:hypothetical protein AB0E75_28910 [Streptomyces griseoviridis]|uniref:Uncharacterized protein n=3 Tax=Streptomyces TaxID=1883 RepID=A0A918LKG7_STRGD|nr:MULTISPECIES: hypothetical protein [Streptomyces]MDP9684407.1 hypothetical protein [Streptomyces griseoviridis]GGS68163.1 hypothetical protein GCM10010238_66050 [Streptomyces niveoruber]GGT22560.1 hypothetical protein GCM10010240_64060 [Streptomyces griseoviridis]GGU64609.1 hypothetical protein GCM10010259_63850 [Streptomyces daghestanicus]GHI30631.1 hypothetical protein Sdagh_23610 [Streptomyces daghestanicus]
MSAPTAPAAGRPGFGSSASGFPGQRAGHLPRTPAPSRHGPQRRLRAAFGLLGPRRERHLVDAGSLAQLSLPVGDDGMVLGIDPDNQPAILGLCRPTRLDVVLVGGTWLAQVIALRAAAIGARVAVETARPQLWSPMAQAAGGGQQCVTVHPVGRIAPQGPSPASPVLIIRDLGIRPPRSRLTTQPWQSVLTLLPYLGPTAPRLLSTADVVGIQRISPQESDIVGRVMRLGRDDVTSLPSLSDSVALWCTQKHRQYVMTQPTDAETGLLGAPRRMD